MLDLKINSSLDDACSAYAKSDVTDHSNSDSFIYIQSDAKIVGGSFLFPMNLPIGAPIGMNIFPFLSSHAGPDDKNKQIAGGAVTCVYIRIKDLLRNYTGKMLFLFFIFLTHCFSHLFLWRSLLFLCDAIYLRVNDTASFSTSCQGKICSKACAWLFPL